MTGTIQQISISPGGVPNHAIPEATLTTTGIQGEAWRYPFHGGLKRAILLITSEGLDDLTAQGFPVYPGALAENLTTLGLNRRLLRLGQQFQVGQPDTGQAIIQLTQVRLPCDTLSVYRPTIQAAMYDARAQACDPKSPVWGLSGFYASVIEPGVLRPGDPISLLE
ncbi:MAG: MOSC domain-containing protein [Acidobacteriota bacterium]